ncbi:E3 ubiquitin/ISG15 ligase TRIM25-like [Hyperolius riggenbachi]|uniref:E3 ubiquitin/ISG15 ligase TRIM25-like n=1 Tax=Hyperolius riggenbachi TaxID=752182 RepID=UPI0035A3726C
MASADLRQDLECPVCLGIYTDPVILRCGHNFCRGCIDRVLDTQEGSGGYSCPECREGFMERPALQRNIALRKIAENFLSTQPDQEEAGVRCSNCVDSSVKAVKYCLHCDVCLCVKHLRAHSKAPEHILCDPNTPLENRKCFVHKKILEYYCTEDAACICVSCRLDGEHRGHQVEMLDEASEMKKKKLRNVLQRLMAETEEAEKRVQSLEECRRKVQEKADGETKRITTLFKDLRRRLKNLEKKVLSDIMRQAEQVSQSYNDIIQQLEIKKEELSRKMRHIEELCNMTDPLTVLQESDTGDLCDTEDRERHDKQLHDGGDLDVAGISHTLHTGLSDILSGVIVQKCTDTQAYPHSSTEDKVPITAKLSRPHPQPTPTAQHTQAYPHSSTEDKVPITAELSRPCPQPTPTAQHTQTYPHSSTEDKVPITATLSRPCPQPTPTTQHTQAYPHSSTEDKVPITAKLSKPHLQPTPTAEHTQHLVGGKIFRSGILYTLYTRLYDMVTVQHKSGAIVQKHTDTQASLHSSTEDKVPITATLSRPRPQHTPTAQHTQHQAGGTNIGAAQQTSWLPVYADILLDVNTAANYLHISAERKTASVAVRSQNHPKAPERFHYNQVLSSQSFSSGRHYWEVDVGGSDYWRVGMCYPSIARRGEKSVIGNNNKSWCLERGYDQYLLIHNRKEIQLRDEIPSDRVRICLDYEAGQISFYALCDPIRHLHTFTAAFTEPLHAVLWVYTGSVKISGEVRDPPTDDITGK